MNLFWDLGKLVSYKLASKTINKKREGWRGGKDTIEEEGEEKDEEGKGDKGDGRRLDWDGEHTIYR